MVKKYCLILYLSTCTMISFAAFERDDHHDRKHHEHKSPRLCEFSLKKDKNYRIIFDQHGKPIALELNDTSRQEQANSAIRAFGLSVVVGFLAECLSIKNNNKPLTHFIGFWGTVAANVLVGGVVCQDRNLITQGGGIFSGYLTGAVARNSVK